MSDFSVYTAEQFVDWLSQATIATAPDPIYVTLFDDTGTELDGDLQNGRVSAAASTDWDVVDTSFENGVEIDFGDATSDITVSEVALYDSDTGGSNNELARYTIESAPRNISSGTRVFFPASQLSFDVVDRTQ